MFAINDIVYRYEVAFTTVEPKWWPEIHKTALVGLHGGRGLFVMYPNLMSYDLEKRKLSGVFHDHSYFPFSYYSGSYSYNFCGYSRRV